MTVRGRCATYASSYVPLGEGPLLRPCPIPAEYRVFPSASINITLGASLGGTVSLQVVFVPLIVPFIHGATSFSSPWPSLLYIVGGSIVGPNGPLGFAPVSASISSDAGTIIWI